MRIAVLGNMNNNHFALCRYLWDLGLDIDLYVLKSDPAHFSIESDLYSSHFLKKIITIDLKISDFPDRMDRYDLTWLNNYDIIVSEGIAAGFLRYFNIKTHVFTPYGGDIYHLPFFRRKNNLKTLLARAKRGLLKRTFLFPKEIFSKYQFNAIKECDLLIAYTHEWKEEFKKLQIKGQIAKIPIPMIYLNDYSPESLRKFAKISLIKNEIDKLKVRFDFLYLNHSRQYWKNHGKGEIDLMSNKGNDKLIVGFAEFLKKTNSNSCLILLEYGVDVQASKELIRSLNIEDSVYWFGIQPRREIMLLIESVDIVCNAFNNSWIGNGVIFETLSMGKPLMGFRDDSLYDLNEFGHKSLYPMINVKEVDEITQALMEYEDNPQYFKNLGLEGKEWYEIEVVEKSTNFYREYFNSKKRELSI
ncbi:glycosyltransferase [Roseivirga thermotolerans]|uniref:glycosyltransferase n=1 Tax=Roseivirga thermotolerans TaxID=1758176 RepID=UPI00273E8251|nr:glycosyltransferase [Roseivirga thermotolerans]